MKTAWFATILFPLAFAGCVGPGPGLADSKASCGASALQGLVGQPQEVLAGMRFSQPLRVIGYGMAVTMDYNPARLNIQLDQRDVIERVSCG